MTGDDIRQVDQHTHGCMKIHIICIADAYSPEMGFLTSQFRLDVSRCHETLKGTSYGKSQGDLYCKGNPYEFLWNVSDEFSQ